MARAICSGGTIYGLTDPVDGGVRYVGKTSRNPRSRLTAHLKQAGEGSLLPLHVWLRSLDHQEPGIVVLERGPNDRDEAERIWIADLRARGADLLNVLAGGTGWTKGMPQSEESNLKRGETQKANGPSENQMAGLEKAREAARAPDVRARAAVGISRAMKGRPAHNKREWTPELRERALEAYSRMSAEEAAKEISVGRRAMFTFLREEGVTRQRHETADPERKKHSEAAKQRMAEIKREHHARGDYRGASLGRPASPSD